MYKSLPTFFTLTLFLTMLVGCGDVKESLDKLAASAEEQLKAEEPEKKPAAVDTPDTEPGRAPKRNDEPKKSNNTGAGGAALAESAVRDPRLRRVYGDKVTDWLLALEEVDMTFPRLGLNRNSEKGDFGVILEKVKVLEAKSDRIRVVGGGTKFEYWLIGKFDLAVGEIGNVPGLRYISAIEYKGKVQVFFISPVRDVEIAESNRIRNNKIASMTPAEREALEAEKKAREETEKAAAEAERKKEYRTWTSGEHKVEARLKSIDPKTVQLERENGKVIDIEISKLSDEDRVYIDKVKKTGKR